MAKRTKESIDSNVDNLNNITPGETPNNKCPDCGMRFARRSYLAEHASIHNGEKPHVCYYCSKAFTLRCNLVRHVRIHTGEKPFACTICKKTFILKKNMIEHKRTHTGEKPFKCLNCEFTFSRRSSLVRHSRIHSGEKMYECHDCKKTFSWKYYLRRHMSIHLTKKNKKTRRTRKSVGVFVKSVENNTFTEVCIKQECFISLPKDLTVTEHSYALVEESCEMTEAEDIKMNNDIINTIPNGIEDTNLNSNEIRDMVQDDKSIVEIHEFDSSQVSENINLPLVKKNLSVVLPKMITLSAQPDALTNDQNKSNVPVPEACEVIKFKMTKTEFDNFCNKRLLVRLQRLDDVAPVEIYEE